MEVDSTNRKNENTDAALILRTHYWNESLEKFSNDLDKNSGLKLFIIVDTTKCDVKIPSKFNVIKINKNEIESLDLFLCEDWGWRCGDYFSIVAASKLHDFKYYWLIEPDVRLKFNDMGRFFHIISQDCDSDLVATGYGPSNPSWYWAQGISELEPEHVIMRCLFPIVRLSKELIEMIHTKRVDHKNKLSISNKNGSKEIKKWIWPNDESITATIAYNYKFSVKDLKEFGYFYDNKSFESTWPWSEKKLQKFENDDKIYHPVLSGDNFKKKIYKFLQHEIESGHPYEEIFRRYQAYSVIEDILLETGSRGVEEYIIERNNLLYKYKNKIFENDFMIKSRNKFTIVACARWESPYIIEWINYYRKIGFDRIFLYCNDDNPTELYEKLLPFTQGNNPFVTFRFYPDQGQQLRMYAHFLQNDRENTDWISFFDVDEYLRLPHGMQIDEFVDRFDSSVDCIMFNWVFFGPDGHKTEAGTSILREYKRRQSSLHPFTKYVARSSILTGPKLNDVKEGHGFWHCPMGHVDQPVNAVNVLGEDMSTYYDGFPSTSSDFVNDPVRREKLLATAVVHHYAFRSEAAFSERVKRGLGGAFDGQTLWGELAASDRFDGFLAGLHEVEDRSLVDFWPEYLKIAQSTNVLDETVLAGMPLSRSKPATQSSISEWSVNLTPEADARGAVNGVINGQGKFHTDLEDAPWWQVDLDRISGISEIRLFNRMDQRERANRLAIDIGLEAGHLIEIYRRESDEPFGGVDGNPLIFKPTIPIPGRFVRIRLLTRNYLHLDQVEIWGEPLPGLADRAAGTA